MCFNFWDTITRLKFLMVPQIHEEVCLIFPYLYGVESVLILRYSPKLF